MSNVPSIYIILFQETPPSAQEQALVVERHQDLEAVVQDRLPLTDQDEVIAPDVDQKEAEEAPIIQENPKLDQEEVIAPGEVDQKEEEDEEAATVQEIPAFAAEDHQVPATSTLDAVELDAEDTDSSSAPSSLESQSGLESQRVIVESQGRIV